MLRHSLNWTGGKKNRMLGFWNWLEAIQMPDANQQFALKEYIDSVRYYSTRLQGIQKQMYAAKSGWSLEPIVEGLMTMRGVNLITAMDIVSELGDLSRFSKPTQLIAT